MFSDHVMAITVRLKIPIMTPNTTRIAAWGRKESKSTVRKWNETVKVLEVTTFKSLLFCIYPNGVKRSARRVADLEVEDSWENEEQAAGSCGSWQRERKGI